MLPKIKNQGLEHYLFGTGHVHKKALVTYSVRLHVCVLREELTCPISVCLQFKLLCSTA